MSLKRLANVWRSARLPWRKEALKGVDQNGNEYYESFARRENTGRTRRWVKTPENREELFEEKQVPVQWQSWLRHRRPVPPTPEEIELANLRRMEIVRRAHEIDRQWEQRKLELNEQARKRIEQDVIASNDQRESGTVPAAAPMSRREARLRERQLPDTFTHPSGQGETFSPGSWTPHSPDNNAGDHSSSNSHSNNNRDNDDRHGRNSNSNTGNGTDPLPNNKQHRS
ncbi:hypothetical protein BDF19DRAFT_432621 [Syncephalis fuscata]|nr:hypothetical protein BDF19DRAFT_432621 [Syncephalis fuscata]